MAASIFEKLSEKLSSVASANNQLKSLRKEDIEDLLDIAISSHTDITTILSLKFDKHHKEWLQEVLKKLETQKSPLKDILSDFQSKLKGKAASLGHDSVFSALTEANKVFSKILNDVKKDIDKFFTTEEVEIYNMKLSLVALMGLLGESDVLINYTIFTFTFFVRAGMDDDSSIPRYRHKYLLDNTAHAAEMVNDLCNDRGNSFLKNVESLQKKGMDLAVANRGKFGIDSRNEKNLMGEGLVSLLFNTISKLNIFTALFDWIDDYKQHKYERNKEISEWLRAHVAALKMEMETYDPNSRQYVKLLNIIRSYDVMISELDEKILDYEEE